MDSLLARYILYLFVILKYIKKRKAYSSCRNIITSGIFLIATP